MAVIHHEEPPDAIASMVVSMESLRSPSGGTSRSAVLYWLNQLRGGVSPWVPHRIEALAYSTLGRPAVMFCARPASSTPLE